MAVSNPGINALSMVCDHIRSGDVQHPRIGVPKLIPKQVRIGMFILIIATFVTIVDYLIQAISLRFTASGAHRSMSSIASSWAERGIRPRTRLSDRLDGLGNGFGFTLVLLCLGLPARSGQRQPRVQAFSRICDLVGHASARVGSCPSVVAVNLHGAREEKEARGDP
jgi:Na+-translocating ferredoxin:NAD+ oxidoreductase RnfE subunit